MLFQTEIWDLENLPGIFREHSLYAHHISWHGMWMCVLFSSCQLLLTDVVIESPKTIAIKMKGNQLARNVTPFDDVIFLHHLNAKPKISRLSLNINKKIWNVEKWWMWFFKASVIFLIELIFFSERNWSIQAHARHSWWWWYLKRNNQLKSKQKQKKKSSTSFHIKISIECITSYFSVDIWSLFNPPAVVHFSASFCAYHHRFLCRSFRFNPS